jgi:Family of unknown function (DUF6158)
VFREPPRGQPEDDLTAATEGTTMTVSDTGVDPGVLPDEDLFRELQSLYRARLHTLRHGPDAALANHFKRTAELESEYLNRFPAREVDPSRLTQDF